MDGRSSGGGSRGGRSSGGGIRDEDFDLCDRADYLEESSILITDGYGSAFVNESTEADERGCDG